MDNAALEFEDDPKLFLEQQGYLHLRQIDGHWYGLYRMMFTVGIVCKLNEIGNTGGRICFCDHLHALMFFVTWDGVSTPGEHDGMTADKRVSRDH